MVRLAVAVLPALFCEVLTSHLKREPGLEVVGRPANVADIGRVLTAEHPQILLFDYDGLGPNPERAISQMRREAPFTRILVLATRPSPETVQRVLRVGASGLVGKDLDIATLLRAIHAVAEGELWAHRRETADFIEHLAASFAQSATPADQLTDREWEIVQRVGLGLRNKEIAHQLSISEKTVKSHLNNIFRKLGIDNRFAAALYGLSRNHT